MPPSRRGTITEAPLLPPLPPFNEKTHLCLQSCETEEPEQLAGSSRGGSLLLCHGHLTERRARRLVLAREEDGRRLHLASAEGECLRQDRGRDGCDDLKKFSEREGKTCLSPDEGAEAASDAEGPLTPSETSRAEPVTAEVDDEHLRDESRHPDNAEDRICEDPLHSL